MKKVRITVTKVLYFKDLLEKDENPTSHACDMKLGQVFISQDGSRPAGFCESAWSSISEVVMNFACGREDIYDAGKKNRILLAMVSCNEGFRPVSFLIGALSEDAE